VILGVHQDVLRSEIAVHDSVVVDVFEGLADRYDCGYRALAFFWRQAADRGSTPTEDLLVPIGRFRVPGVSYWGRAIGRGATIFGSRNSSTVQKSHGIKDTNHPPRRRRALPACPSRGLRAVARRIQPCSVNSACRSMQTPILSVCRKPSFANHRERPPYLAPSRLRPGLRLIFHRTFIGHQGRNLSARGGGCVAAWEPPR